MKEEIVNIIAEKIMKLFDASLRQKIGEKNKEIVKRKFNWKEIINKYVELYTQLIEQSNDKQKSS